MTTTIEQVARVADRAASDSAFRQRLLSDPAATLRSEGVDVGEGTTVRVLENTGTLRHLVLRPRPAGASDADLAALPAGGGEAQPLAAHARLLADTWVDAGLRARVLGDPAAVLAERGIAVPAGVTVRAVDAASEEVYLVLAPAGAS